MTVAKTCRTPRLIPYICLFVFLAALTATPSSSPTPVDPSLKLLREAALMLLKEGNHRFATGKSQHPNLDATRRTHSVASGQEPFATILACSDSRHPVELCFDRGIGDLFVVRVAGNVAGSSELASIEYGVDHLRTPLLVVMGHSHCGAVSAVVQGIELHGHLAQLAEKIRPALGKTAGSTNASAAVISEVIEANVWHTMAGIIKQSSAVRARIKSGQTLLIGAIYDLETGQARWLGVHPELDALLAASPASDPATASTSAGSTEKPSDVSQREIDDVLNALARPVPASDQTH